MTWRDALDRPPPAIKISAGPCCEAIHFRNTSAVFPNSAGEAQGDDRARSWAENKNNLCASPGLPVNWYTGVCAKCCYNWGIVLTRAKPKSIAFFR